MKVTNVEQQAKLKLYNSLFTYTKSLMRRGVTIIPIAYSGRFGSLEITVVGNKGIATKSMVVCLDTNELGEQKWLAISDGVEYEMIALREITNLLRTKLQKLSTLVSKI